MIIALCFIFSAVYYIDGQTALSHAICATSFFGAFFSLVSLVVYAVSRSMNIN